MIRRILNAELSDVRALASDVKRRACNAFHRNVYVSLFPEDGCIMLGRPPRDVGIGFIVNSDDRDHWPDGARLLTIGRVTLAAWGGRQS